MTENQSGDAALPSPPTTPQLVNPMADASAIAPTTAETAIAANASLPLSNVRDSPAAPFFVRASTGLDRLRSTDCLAQSVYYEARSEPEDGQRAVAQVVLNRLRHSSYPNSVCGVVYQGPMRPGGGCQFTFTCDGSLARAPSGPAWLAARRIAAEALAGRVYAPVGHATHYHTTSVFPHWAPRLVKSTLIGSHIFYRFPGQLGAPGAFLQSYAGREPLPVPSRIGLPAQPSNQFSSLDVPTRVQTAPESLALDLPDNLPGVELTERGLPESRVREAYMNAGRIRPDRVSPPNEPAPGS